MKKRRPILLIDDSPESSNAIKILVDNNVDFVKYHIRKFEESCCDDIPTTHAPSIFAVNGVFKGLDGIEKFLQNMRESSDLEDSSYW